MALSRRYRLLCIVVAGLMLTSAKHPDLESKHSQKTTVPPLVESVANIAAWQSEAAKRANKSDRADALCGPNQYENRSELCAQWKAADAAADSAWWAWASGFVGIFSLLGVLGAQWFAYRANKIASDTATRQIRAYLALPKLKGRINAGRLELKLCVSNTGQTPALEVIAEYKLCLDGTSGPQINGASEYVAAHDRRYLAPVRFQPLDGSVSRFTVQVVVRYKDVIRKDCKINEDSESYTGDLKLIGDKWTAITTRAWVREVEAEVGPSEEPVAEAGTNG